MEARMNSKTSQLTENGTEIVRLFARFALGASFLSAVADRFGLWGQILWFQVQDGIVHATTAKDSFWVNYQLAELEAALPPDEFFRARREVLVNISRIKEIKPYFKSSFLLVMSDAASTEIAVSERQARPLRQRLPGL